MKTLIDVSGRLFTEFQRGLEGAINDLLPNSFPALVSIMQYCKNNGIDRNNRLSPGYADLLAWYENIDGYDSLIMRDQNETFLAIKTGDNSVKVYTLNYFYNIDDMAPSIKEFNTVVAPWLREDELKWSALFEAMEAGDEKFDGISAGNKEPCRIEPLFSLTFVQDSEGKVHKHVLLRAGFDLISGIKTLNSFENQIAQYVLAVNDDNAIDSLGML